MSLCCRVAISVHRQGWLFLVRDRFVRSDDQRPSPSHRHRSAEPSDTTLLLRLIRALKPKKYVRSFRVFRIDIKTSFGDICKNYNMQVRSRVSRVQPISSEQPVRSCVKQDICLNMNIYASMSHSIEDCPLTHHPGV